MIGKIYRYLTYLVPAFEGLAHPYKENIVKFGNKSVLNHPEVQEAFKEAKPSA